MATSNVTKHYRIGYWVTLVLSWVVPLIPLIYYTIVAFMNGTPGQKMGLGFMFVVAIILTVLNVLMKWHLRCTLWIIVLGITFCLNEIMTLLIFMAITTIADEVVLTPLHKYYKTKLSINKEIDKRG